MTLMFTGNIPGETYLEASEYGFSNSLFVYNAGTYILSFLGFVAIIPCIYLLSKITHGYLGVQCEKILKSKLLNHVRKYLTRKELENDQNLFSKLYLVLSYI